MSWPDTALTRLLGVAAPIIAAPMAGGPSTPALAAAVSEAGGLGSLAGAGLGPDALRAAVAAIRALTTKPFAVNLFAPLPPPSDEHVAAWSQLTGMPIPASMGPAAPAAPAFEDQLAVLAELRVPVVSFTFGNPALGGLDALRIGTATTAAEAEALEAAGVDVVVAQGYEAGGHRGTFDGPVAEALIGTLVLVPQVVDAVSVPVVAAGGIMDGRGIAAALALGAAGVAMGTAFLCCDEAGTAPEHRKAVGRPTTVTTVLTGRHARAVRTVEVDRLEASGQPVPDFPLPRAFQREPAMLVGQGGSLARSMPAGDLVRALVEETAAVLAALRGTGG